MAVIDGIRLPEFGVPAFMPSTCEVASEPAKPMSEDKIYVAVGKDVKESKSKLVWTVRQSKGNLKICIIHVLVPSRRIPMGGLGAGIPASSANERALREHRENERKNMHELLENYLLVCRQMGVRAEKEYIESDSVERGILELIHLRGIRWLVMGFRADKRYFKFHIGRRMTEIKSRKAIFVRDKAPISCQIWFIFDGRLIHAREAQTVQPVVEVPTHVPLLTTLSPGAEQCAVMPPPPSSTDSSLVHSDAASMPERPDTFQKLERVSTSPSHRPQSFYYTSLSSNSLDMNENDAQEVLEEGVTTCAKVEVDIIKGGPKDPRKFGVPAVMPSFRRVAPELVTPDFEDVIYVAAGKDVKEGKAKLVWTVHQSRGNVKICIIHVLVPSKTIPMGGLGAEIPVNSANEILLREHRENERINMHKILDTYLLVCTEMGVPAEKKYIESDSVQKGIVELIRSHGIRKLVIGAAADGGFFEKMTEIKSRKAIFVHDKAHVSCQIRFICNGHLIHTREAQTVEAIVEVPTDATSPTTPALGAGKSVFLKSQSATQRSGTAKLSNPFQDLMRRAFSLNADRRSVRSIASPSPDSTPSEQPNAVTMLRSQDTFQELESFSTSLVHCPQWNESAYLTGHSSFFNTLGMNVNAGREVLEEEEVTLAKVEVDIIEEGQKDPTKMKYPQRSYAEKLEEELEKVKNQLDKVMEEHRIAQDQKSQLKSQFVETDQSRKELEMKIISSEEVISTYRQEREQLQNELDNALQEVEEVSRRQGHSSGTKYFSEFSMTEIKEAVQNFEPSLKIGEGSCGIVYKGFLRHMPVAIKTMKSQSMEGSQQFQQEVELLSKVRHPNLIMLIGACAEPLTLVYEYFPNGSLEDWLHSSNRAKQLSWRARIRIATELCSVLAFLHSYKPHSIVHGDVKPANILLDAHLGCKLSDFGICRLLSQGEQSSNNTTVLYPTVVKGTLGYMDPEILITRELTTKFDVFSFGIILLQLLTRRPALGLVNEVQKAINAGTLKAILDPLAGEWPYMLAKELTHLALRCCEMSRRNRPDLGSDVWTVLQSIRASLGYT